MSGAGYDVIRMADHSFCSAEDYRNFARCHLDAGHDGPHKYGDRGSEFGRAVEKSERLKPWLELAAASRDGELSNPAVSGQPPDAVPDRLGPN